MTFFSTNCLSNIWGAIL